MNIKLMYLFCLIIFVTSATAVISVAYQTSGLKNELSAIRREISGVRDSNTQFKTDVYVGIAHLINGQKVLVNGGQALSFGQLRIHHFVEPHSDKFYPGCQECAKEKKEIVDEDIITVKK